jgi:hypothetical protein
VTAPIEVVITLRPDSPRWADMDPEAVAAAAREAVDALLYRGACRLALELVATLRGRGLRLVGVEAITPGEARR